MQKNTIIFTVVSFLFILIYFLFIVPKYVPQPTPQKQTSTNTENLTNNNLNVSKTDENAVKQDQKVKSDNNKIKALLEGEKETINEFSNQFIYTCISSIGGKILSYRLKEYEKKDLSGGDLVVPNNDKTKEGLQDINPVETLFINNNTMEIAKKIKFKFIESLSNEKTKFFKIIINDDKNKPVEIDKIYRFNNNYEVSIIFKIKGLDNNIPYFKKDKLLSLISWAYLLGPEDILSSRYNRQVFSVFFNNKYNKIGLKNNRLNKINKFDWISVSNLYFALIIKRDDLNNYHVNVTKYNKYDIEFHIIPDNFELIENVYKFKIYFLPKDRKLVAQYDKTFKSVATSGGMLAWLVIGFNWILGVLYSIFHNWGIAIIMLTIIIKALLYPFTHKSMVSMKKMSVLGPKIKEIQDKYKGDPQKAQVEITNLYKKEGVNPLSGCLPLLLQMPFLIALFNSLLYNLSLRNSSFLWIKDLSNPDVIYTLKFSLPLIGNSIRALPIIMTIVSLVQSEIQSKGQVAANPEQKMQTKMMTYLMPILFLFLFYNMSAGLVLYWTTMSLLTLIENLYTNYREDLKLKQIKQTK